MRWTEKQMEAYLADETRPLTGPDGCTARVTMFKLDWITFDAVLVDDVYTEAELVAWASQRVAEEGISFTEAFRGNMGLLDREIRRQNSQA